MKIFAKHFCKSQLLKVLAYNKFRGQGILLTTGYEAVSKCESE